MKKINLNKMRELLNKILEQLIKLNDKKDHSNPYRLINCYVCIGKSKEEILISFPIKDYIKIEKGLLYLTTDERVLHINADNQIGVREQMLDPNVGSKSLTNKLSICIKMHTTQLWNF